MCRAISWWVWGRWMQGSWLRYSQKSVREPSQLTTRSTHTIQSSVTLVRNRCTWSYADPWWGRHCWATMWPYSATGRPHRVRRTPHWGIHVTRVSYPAPSRMCSHGSGNQTSVFGSNTSKFTMKYWMTCYAPPPNPLSLMTPSGEPPFRGQRRSVSTNSKMLSNSWTKARRTASTEPPRSMIIVRVHTRSSKSY